MYTLTYTYTAQCILVYYSNDVYARVSIQSLLKPIVKAHCDIALTNRKT